MGTKRHASILLATLAVLGAGCVGTPTGTDPLDEEATTGGTRKGGTRTAGSTAPKGSPTTAVKTSAKPSTGTGASVSPGASTTPTGSVDPNASPTPVTSVAPNASPDPNASASPTTSAAPSGAPTVTPVSSATPSIVPVPTKIQGRVFYEDGTTPAEGIDVKAYVTGGIAAPAATVKSDAEGRFTLDVTAGATLNVEAVEDTGALISRDVKIDVLAGAINVELKLARTGSVQGLVTATRAQAAGTLQNVDVFIDGTAYATKTDAAGFYTLDGVPPGTYSLTARKNGVGEGIIAGVEVKASEATRAPDFVFSIVSTSLTGLSVSIGGAGTNVVLAGIDLGGTSVGVKFGSVDAVIKTKTATTIEAVVPAGAVNGNVTATIDGKTTNGLPFTVVKAIDFSPASKAQTSLKIGQSYMFDGVYVDTDNLTTTISSDNFFLSAAPTGASTMNDAETNFTPVAGGAVVPSVAGTFILTITSGTLTANLPVTVTP